MQTEDLISILPEIIITVVAACVLMVDAFGAGGPIAACWAWLWLGV